MFLDLRKVFLTRNFCVFPQVVLDEWSTAKNMFLFFSKKDCKDLKEDLGIEVQTCISYVKYEYTSLLNKYFEIVNSPTSNYINHECGLAWNY